MTTLTAARTAGTTMDTGDDIKAMDTLRRGVRISPELREDRRGGTVVVVAYRKATIALADEVVHLEDGRIADRGTHEELLARSPAYAHLVNAYEQQTGELVGEVTS